MDFQALLNFTRRRRKALLVIAALGSSGYGIYWLYQSPSVTKKKIALVRFFKALMCVADTVSNSTETLGIVSRDLKLFLRSESDEIPNSLRQISKIARSKDFSASLVNFTEAFTVGVLRGYKLESRKVDELQADTTFPDRILDKLFSKAGTGFASVVVGSLARNLVMGFYSAGRAAEGLDVGGVRRSEGSSASPQWVDWVCSDKCRELIGDCIRLFVSTAVSAYLDRTIDINTYDEIFSGLTNPKHESKMKDMLVSICNGAIETLVKTSQRVLAAPRRSPNSNSDLVLKRTTADESTDSKSISAPGTSDFLSELSAERPNDESKGSSGWISQVSSTLAVPSNRSFVLDVTGKVTFETVRSFLDFSSWKLQDGLRKGTSVIHGEAVARGMEVLRCIGAKSVVIATICLALCLHVLLGTRTLLPA